MKAKIAHQAYRKAKQSIGQTDVKLRVALTDQQFSRV